MFLEASVCSQGADPIPPPGRPPCGGRHLVAATAAVGMYPTGMHSCCDCNCKIPLVKLVKSVPIVLLAMYLLVDEFGDNVSGVHVDGTDRHDLLSVSLAELSDQHGDEGVELRHLLLEVVLERVLVPLLQASERDVHLCRPPDLCAAQSNL